MAVWWVWAFAALVPLLVTLIWLLLSPRPTSVDLKSCHVLITGGSSGIGLAMAQHLTTAEGARVSIVGRDIARLTSARQSILDYYAQRNRKQKSASGRTQNEMLSSGADVHYFSADVKSFGSIEKAVNAAVSESGPVDVLICCHGVSVPQTFEDSSLETMDYMLDTNLRGNIHAIKAALPHIKNRTSTGPGCICIVTSQAAQAPIYGFAAYAASKCGLRGLAEALQQELLPDNIRLSLVYPPDTQTPGFDEENKTKPDLTRKLSETSQGMQPMDVAKTAIKGLKAGQFNISCNLEGVLLRIVTAGMSPQPSLLHALMEIFLMGLVRFISLFIIFGWYKTIMAWHQSQKKKTL